MSVRIQTFSEEHDTRHWLIVWHFIRSWRYQAWEQPETDAQLINQDHKSSAPFRSKRNVLDWFRSSAGTVGWTFQINQRKKAFALRGSLNIIFFSRSVDKTQHSTKYNNKPKSNSSEERILNFSIQLQPIYENTQNSTWFSSVLFIWT